MVQVHSAILEDLVHPTEIVGKRIRFDADGGKVMKVLLDPKDKNIVEYKLETYAGTHPKLLSTPHPCGFNHKSNALECMAACLVGTCMCVV